ncbi:MAG: P1 family peptidase [Atopobiaceae bacterium]|nr:P1 family peptidase [Atopobiaceae bacterium]
MQSVTQIPGVLAGHVTKADAGTGCTVLVFPQGAVGAVDVRGGAPATRETDLLRPENTVQQVHAVILSGGSAYGLAASCGVADELERAGIGLDVGVGIVPIVVGACLFDLGVGRADVRPTAEDGAGAVRAAMAERDVPASERTPLEQGNVGAGTGCSVGKLAGATRAMKCGLGESVQTAGPLACGAVVAVNAFGGVVDPDTGERIAGLLSEDGTCVEDCVEAALALTAQTLEKDPRALSWLRTNTTISCVVTNAQLTQAQATKVAQIAADGYAHAIRPVHTTNDGDTIFVVATGDVPAGVDAVGMLATRAVEAAIVNAARAATSAYGLKAADSVHA